MRNTCRSLLLAASALAFAGHASAQTKWDLASAYPATGFHTENLVQFAADVDKATTGKLKIEVHPAASLFKATEIKRAVQQGSQAQAGEILMSNFANEHPVYALDSLPFLANSYDDARMLYRMQRPLLEKVLADQGMKLLYAVPWPPQGIFTRKLINAVADMRGFKWRSYSPVTAKIAELIGAQPVSIQAAELTQALATGTIDSYMSSGATGYDSKTYEYIKNYYDTQAWLPKNIVIVNKKAFDALDKPTREALTKAADEAETRGWKTSAEKTEFYKHALSEKGMTIHRPHMKLKNDLRQIGEIMLADWEKTAGADSLAVVAAYKKEQAGKVGQKP